MMRVAVLLAGAAILASCSGAQRPAHTRVASAFKFTCEPRDARVIVDETDEGVCVLWESRYLGLGPGTHRLRIERENYLPVEQDLAETGGRQTVHVRLRERPE